jgi:hypothetical protein
MKHGKTERETLDLNGWTIGDILEGDEGYGPQLIKITAVGEERFLCRWNYQKGKGWERESGQTTLSCREWRKVSSVNSKTHEGKSLS